MKNKPTGYRPVLVVLAVVAICGPARASWSGDAAVNVAIADRSGEQAQPKLATRSDGKIYVSWLDNSAGGYDVYLQLLDDNGNELWPHNGVLVADRSFSSTQDYGLSVDTAGNALLAFRDDRGDGVNITAAAVDSNGALLWGGGGVQLANPIGFVAAPKITGTSDGAAVIAWTNNADVILQKLDSAGTPLWGAGVVLSDTAAGNFSASDLNASDAGSVIVSLVRQTTFSSPKHLYAQKLSAGGAILWGTDPVVVFDGGSLQFGNFPIFVTDGSGGAVFAWYDTAAGLQCFVQRILNNGAERFSHNGVAVSTAPRDRVSPVAVFDPAGESIYAFWREQLPGPFPEDGVYGQKLDVDGVRQWTDSGIAVASLATDELTQVRAVAQPGGAMVLWVRAPAFDNDEVLAARIDDNGDTVWNPSQTPVATATSGKSRLFASGNPGGFVALGWSDNRTDANDIYVQNVNANGSLGVALPDTDEDGITDDADNCTLTANPSQRDTNADGFGNFCDADLNNDCIVNFIDLNIVKKVFFAADADADFNGDELVNFADLEIMKTSFFGPPGPSGLPNACP